MLPLTILAQMRASIILSCNHIKNMKTNTKGGNDINIPKQESFDS